MKSITPDQTFQAEWAELRARARREGEASYKPDTYWEEKPILHPYLAEICIRKNDERKSAYDETVARAVITDTSKSRIVFDYGKWAQEHLVRAKLDAAINELEELIELRRKAAK